jgi:hypothetical protein
MNPALASAEFIVKNICKDVTIDDHAVHEAALQVRHFASSSSLFKTDFQSNGDKGIQFGNVENP